MNIGKSIREKRRAVGLSQVELAEKTGLKQSTISSIENEINKPAIETIVLISQALDCTVSDIIGDSVIRKNDNLTDQEAEIIYMIRKLNATGQRRVFETIQTFTTLPEYQRKDLSESAI